MSKAFTKETDEPDEELENPEPLPAGQKNYVTSEGLTQLKDELNGLLRVERPKIVEIVSWAAGNGDRSENGDYIYGKKRLREIDRRANYLMKRIDSALVVDTEKQKKLSQVFFGATVEYIQKDKTLHRVKIVGIDEADLQQGKISWLSPVAKALQKAYVGDHVILRTPSGVDTLEVVSISYT